MSTRLATLLATAVLALALAYGVGAWLDAAVASVEIGGWGR